MAKSRRDIARKRKTARVAPDARKTAPAKAKRKPAAKPKAKPKSETETKRAKKAVVAVAPPVELAAEEPCAQAPTIEPAPPTLREALAHLELVAVLGTPIATPAQFDAPAEEAPPFDPPDEAEWMLEGAVASAEQETFVEVFAAAPPPFDLYTRAPPSIPRPNTDERREVLQRARLAAQAHGEALQKQQAQLRARLFGGGVYGIGVGFAACVVLGTAMLLQGGGDEPTPLTPSAEAATLTAAPVAAQREAPADHAQTYAAALRLLEGGDSEAGVRLLRRAAEGGLAVAQYRLSKHYERSDGAPQSLALALQWAARAAEAGNVRAMHDVGVFYARGDAATPDEAEAFRWFRQAAEYGVADSQYNLGVLYLQGRGVAADPREALFWFLVAAHNDDANAIDRAVAVASTLTPQEVAQLRERARAFQARAPNPEANAS